MSNDGERSNGLGAGDDSELRSTRDHFFLIVFTSITRAFSFCQPLGSYSRLTTINLPSPDDGFGLVSPPSFTRTFKWNSNSPCCWLESGQESPQRIATTGKESRIE